MWKLSSIIAAVALVGCSEVPTLPAPDYSAPANREAYKAFKAAMKTDWVNKPFKKGNMPNHMTAMNYNSFYKENRRQIANRNAKRAYKALRRVELGECQWQALSSKDVPKWAAHRIHNPPSGAYGCLFVAHYLNNPRYGKKRAVNNEGRFFIGDDGRLTYLGRFRHPY